MSGNDHDHHDHHGHDHSQDHAFTRPPSELELRVKALESLLVAKKAIDPANIDAIIDLYERRIGPRIGAQIVARAWADDGFRERLLTHPDAAIAEFAIPGVHGENLAVVENRPGIHNVIVCTLCSCYPWQTMGLPPAWFKSAAYRSRVVADPRAVLREFGLDIPVSVGIRVWDSNAEIRYMVLPERPGGTDNWSEERLAALVTRDSMIGTGLALPPDAAPP